MTSPRHFDLGTPRPFNLRVGVKWDPIARDELNTYYGFADEATARAAFASTQKIINVYTVIIKLLKATFILETFVPFFERFRGYKIAAQKDIKNFLSEGKLASFNLDLCCYCYDKYGDFVGFISPVMVDQQYILKQDQLAFMHTGDEQTGAAKEYDEEILVNIPAIDPRIEQIFFVIHSVNHSFKDIKGGLWAVISTQGEKVLMSLPLETASDCRLHVIAQLDRKGTSWSLTEIAQYHPLDKQKQIPTYKTINALLMKEFAQKPKAAVEAS
jgi:hypothetical protein